MKLRPSLAHVQRLLIVKTSSIGDVIHALPVVQSIKEAHQELMIDWVVRQRCAEVLRGNPWVNQLYVVADKPGWSDLIELRQKLRAAHYDCALDMQGLFLSGLLTRLSGAPIRIGWDRNRESNVFWLTHPIVPGRVSDARGDTHEVSALFGFADFFGVSDPPKEFPPQPYLTKESAVQAERWLHSLPLPRIALNVGASRGYKRWPVEYWAQVADCVSEKGFGIVFLGSKQDAEMVAQVQACRERTRNDIDLSGKTDLRQLAAVLEACDLVISGDTGPMHMAVAVGTPVVAVFGATNPARHGPYGARNVVLRPPAATYSKGRPTDSEGEAAMRAILPDAVLEAVLSRVKQ